MNFKQFSQVTKDYAVLATRKEDFSGPCHDHKDDDHNYFWVLVDGGDGADDFFELVEVDVDGRQRICERCLVVEKKTCTICGQKMNPRYDNRHDPVSWQECPACGYVLDTSLTDTDGM